MGDEGIIMDLEVQKNMGKHVPSRKGCVKLEIHMARPAIAATFEKAKGAKYVL